MSYQMQEWCSGGIMMRLAGEGEHSRPAERLMNARPRLSHLRTLLFDPSLSVFPDSSFQVCPVQGSRRE